jgi:hypothetical protein
MATFFAMRIPFEDRSDESGDQVLARRVAKAGQLLLLAAVQVSDATPAVGVGALALALGHGAARTGAALDQVLDAVRQYYASSVAAIAADGDDRDGSQGGLN